MIDDQEIPLTCLGKPIHSFEAGVPFGIPVDVFVLARVIDEDGEEGYRMLSNPEMSTVTIVGACEWATNRIKNAWVVQGRQAQQGDDDAKEEGA